MTQEELGSIATIISGCLIVLLLTLIGLERGSWVAVNLAVASAVVGWLGNMALSVGVTSWWLSAAFLSSVILAIASCVASAFFA